MQVLPNLDWQRSTHTHGTKDKALRSHVLVPMLHPIKDTSDPNHSLKPEATKKYISDNGLTFEDLKKELPKLKESKETAE
eukprot:7855127-Ditylum_brightwellii.AAC.1